MDLVSNGVGPRVDEGGMQLAGGIDCKRFTINYAIDLQRTYNMLTYCIGSRTNSDARRDLIARRTQTPKNTVVGIVKFSL